MKIWEFLQGKKTYIGAAVIFVAGGLRGLCDLPVAQVCLSDEYYKWLVAIGGAIAVFGLRFAISDLVKKL